MHTSRSQVVNLQQGMVITGRWHKQSYYIIKKLGSGATGSVYLAHINQKKVALKISNNDMAITSEVNVLKHFSKVQGKILGPSLIDVDDCYVGMTKYSFYVMEYLSGEPILDFINNRGKEWLGIFIIQLLSDLHELHKAGWAFGDLKPDNLLIVGPPPKIRWLDVGGTTLIGRSIKEYTEFFDRGYWGMGTRKAEPSYDLFAVGMIMLNASYPKRFEKNNGGLIDLMPKIEQSALLKSYKPVLVNALQGKYKTAVEMKNDMMNVTNATSSTRPSRTTKTQRYKNPSRKINSKRNSYHTRTNNSSNISKSKPQSKLKGAIETVILTSFIVLIYMIYLFGESI
jgi:serine/threonine protein kinase, bacterial